METDSCYNIVCGTVTVRLGIDKSVKDSKSNGPMTAKLNKDDRRSSLLKPCGCMVFVLCIAT